nr:biotin/lipoyl-containing protein [uncultured Cohaesibacter sp.]
MEIKTKMPSLIEKIEVTVGQTVSKGDILCIVEAMKMKNKMPSPIDGTVSSIAAKEGDRLKPGAVILVVDPA